jgi:hypothetical protein
MANLAILDDANPDWSFLSQNLEQPFFVPLPDRQCHRSYLFTSLAAPGHRKNMVSLRSDSLYLS